MARLGKAIFIELGLFCLKHEIAMNLSPRSQISEGGWPKRHGLSSTAQYRHNFAANAAACVEENHEFYIRRVDVLDEREFDDGPYKQVALLDIYQGNATADQAQLFIATQTTAGWYIFPLINFAVTECLLAERARMKPSNCFGATVEELSRRKYLRTAGNKCILLELPRIELSQFITSFSAIPFSWS